MSDKNGGFEMKLPNSYVVIDIETTGFSRRDDRIIELAALKVVDNKIVDEFDSFVNPTIEIPPFITQLTSITNADVNNAPVFKDIIIDYLRFIDKCYIVGHNITTFDIGFINQRICDTLDTPQFQINNSAIDTMYLSRAIFIDKPHHKLRDVCTMLNIEYIGAHRAINDCRITQKCYEALKAAITTKSIDVCAGYAEYLKYRREHKVISDKKAKSKLVTAQNNDFDTNHPLYGKICVFTGALSLPRIELMQKVANVGGINNDNVTRKTDYLIVGDYRNANLKGDKSTKIEKAEELIVKGNDILIISEEDFFDLLENKKECLK